MHDEQLLTGYRKENVGRMEKREINDLEPYLDKRSGFTWLPKTNTDLYASEIAHANMKLSQDKRDLLNIPDYLLWSIGNFFLFFVFGIICIILSLRVREHKRKKVSDDNDEKKIYNRTLRMSQRTLVMNISTTIIGITFLVIMLGILINKSSTNF